MILENVKLINPFDTINNANIYIKNGIIKKIVKIDGCGTKTIIPGFIDVHTHGAMNIDVMDGVEAIEKISELIVQFGTTSFIPTLMTASKEEVLKSFRNAAKASSKGSKILGLHIEGPWISKAKKGAHIEKYLYSPTIDDVKLYQKAANGKLIRIDFAPEVVSTEIIKEMISHGIVPVVGHTNATYEVATEAFNNGAKSATHLWNGMSGITGRNPGAILAAMDNKNCMPEIICDFVHVSPEVVRMSINKIGVDRVILITDSIRPAGMPNGRYVSGGQPVIKKDFSINVISHGSLAGGASMMIDQFKNILSLGYSVNDAIKMTSYNAAKNHNLEQSIGSIEVGKQADILLFNNELSNIESVYINGKIQ